MEGFLAARGRSMLAGEFERERVAGSVTGRRKGDWK